MNDDVNQGFFELNNDQKLAYRMSGKGKITVIFEAGLGTEKETWNTIQTAISKFSKTISYDRLGNGGSSISTKKRTIKNIYDDFKKLIDGLDLKPPFILVGHSIGCIFNKYAAKELGDNIIGQVFVDGSDPRYLKTTYDYRTPIQAKYWKGLCEGEEEDEKIDSNSEEAVVWELADDFHKTPFRQGVQSSVIVCGNLTGWFQPNKSSEFDEKLAPKFLLNKDNETWIDIHKEWADEMPISTFVVAEDSGHLVHEDNPELVINEIVRVLELAKLT